LSLFMIVIEKRRRFNEKEAEKGPFILYRTILAPKKVLARPQKVIRGLCN